MPWLTIGIENVADACPGANGIIALTGVKSWCAAAVPRSVIVADLSGRPGVPAHDRERRLAGGIWATVSVDVVSRKPFGLSRACSDASAGATVQASTATNVAMKHDEQGDERRERQLASNHHSVPSTRRGHRPSPCGRPARHLFDVVPRIHSRPR